MMPDLKHVKNERQQLAIILSIVLIGFIGTSMAYPIFPPLFLHPSQAAIVPLHWDTDTRSILLGIALAVYPLGQFIGSPILGGSSDRYGRKSILTISLGGCSVGYFFSALAIYENCLWLLLISRFLTGLMEGNLAIVRAMAIDLKSINKFKSLGRINGIASIGYVMGPLLGGFLSDNHLVPWFSFAFPFLLAAIFSTLTIILAVWRLTDHKTKHILPSMPIWQQFNLSKRFRHLFQNNPELKNLLIISSVFTFAVDIFYEFGPVYLTGLWLLTPAGIAIYNAALCVSLALGSSWIPHHLSRYLSLEKAMALSMLITGLVLGLMAILPTPLFAFILFTAIGLSIAAGTTNITIQISNAADESIQGEAMGAQLSLRMLGDTLICLVGGFIIIYSVVLPIAISCLIAFIAAAMYTKRYFLQ